MFAPLFKALKGIVERFCNHGSLSHVLKFIYVNFQSNRFTLGRATHNLSDAIFWISPRQCVLILNLSSNNSPHSAAKFRNCRFRCFLRARVQILRKSINKVWGTCFKLPNIKKKHRFWGGKVIFLRARGRKRWKRLVHVPKQFGNMY